MAAASALDLVVRFSSSNADVILRVDRPDRISNATIKHRIRAELEAPASESRLRLIHAGKVLADAAALAASVTVTIPPPRDEGTSRTSEKAKGKLPVREQEQAVGRVYIHCSIGDILTPSELAAEAKAAAQADAALASERSNNPATEEGTGEESSTTTPAPRGFDRLLSAGFTASEVASLRTQFLAIQSHTHTPDTMPTGSELLALEERWLDSGSSPAGGNGEGGAEEADAGGLEDMLYGNLIGFFWPIGAMFWVMREEGIWTRRKQVAVLSGFLVNLTFGALRVWN